MSSGSDDVATITALAGELLDDCPPGLTPRREFLDARFAAGLAWVHFPTGDGGLGVARDLQATADRILDAAGAPSPTERSPIGHRIVAPIIARYGSEAQRARLGALYVGDEEYCQLFSEPGAGSDLAALRTQSVWRDGVWSVTGHKTWTSGAHRARWGLALLRTGGADSGRRGLSLFLVDMRAAGITVRPLRQITGDAEFNEVFFDAVAVPDDARLGPVGDGWAIAMATLAEERRNIGQERMYSGGDVVDHALAAYRTAEHGAVHRHAVVDLLARRRLLADTSSRMAATIDPHGSASVVAKVLSSELTRDAAELLADMGGAHTMLYAGGYRSTASDAVYRFEHPTQFLLRSRAATIAGGTSEVMRTVIAERVLGLPRQ